MNDHYAELYSSYRWFVPTQFNIAQACVHRWAENPHEGRRIALHVEDEIGQGDAWSYSRLSETVNQLANGLIKMGVCPGDRIAIVMGQRPEIVVAYMAAFSVGAIAMPLPGALGPEAISIRLRDAKSRVAIVDTLSGPDVLQAQMDYPALAQIIGLGFQHENTIPWRTLLARQPTVFKARSTTSASPALLVYANEQTKAAKGALLAHSTLIGNLPGFVAAQDWFPQRDDLFWTPADWTSVHGLFNALLPCLYFGRPIVAALGRSSGERAFEIMQRYKITNAFMSLDMLEQLHAAQQPDLAPLALRSMSIQGPRMHATLFEWAKDTIGITPNLVYGQIEANLVIGGSAQRWPTLPDSVGRAYPGHLLSVLDSQGKIAPAGVVGEIAINRYDIVGYPDPALFLGYWTDDAATRSRFHGDWFLTGVLGTVDKNGYFRLTTEA